MTVEELEPRLTMREVVAWQEFEAEFGPLTIQERIDAMGAHVAYVVHASLGGEMRPEDFIRRWQRRPALDGDGIAAFFSAISSRAS